MQEYIVNGIKLDEYSQAKCFQELKGYYCVANFSVFLKGGKDKIKIDFDAFIKNCQARIDNNMYSKKDYYNFINLTNYFIEVNKINDATKEFKKENLYLAECLKLRDEAKYRGLDALYYAKVKFKENQDILTQNTEDMNSYMLALRKQKKDEYDACFYYDKSLRELLDSSREPIVTPKEKLEEVQSIEHLY